MMTKIFMLPYQCNTARKENEI